MQEGEINGQNGNEIKVASETDAAVSEIKTNIVTAKDNKTVHVQGYKAMELFSNGLIQQDELKEIFKILSEKVIKNCEEVRAMLHAKIPETSVEEMKQLIIFHYDNGNIPDTDALSMLEILDMNN